MGSTQYQEISIDRNVRKSYNDLEVFIKELLQAKIEDAKESADDRLNQFILNSSAY